MNESIFPVLLQFFLSATAIIIAGTWLVRFSDHIADATKLGRLFVGSIFLAGATSLPELFVDISAIRNNMPDLALGDLLGSSIFNLLILAIADLMHRGTSSIFSRASAKHAFAGTLSIAVTAIVGAAIALEAQLGSFLIGDIGLGTISIAIAFIFGLRLIFYNDKAIEDKIEQTSVPNERASLSKAVIGYLISALGLLIAAPYLAESAAGIAHFTGLGKTFIGTTMVAFSTSLPELVATVAAVRRGAFDLALGNIFGSNTFNMILLTPLDAFYKGSLLASVSPIHIVTCFSTILITSVAIMGQLYQVEKRKRFIEPDAFTVIFLALGSITILYFIDR